MENIFNKLLNVKLWKKCEMIWTRTKNIANIHQRFPLLNNFLILFTMNSFTLGKNKCKVQDKGLLPSDYVGFVSILEDRYHLNPVRDSQRLHFTAEFAVLLSYHF